MIMTIITNYSAVRVLQILSNRDVSSDYVSLYKHSVKIERVSLRIE